LMLLISSCGSNLKFFGKFCGKVIDKETNEPIEGAVVIASWETLNLTNNKHSLTRPHKVAEVVSNSNGEFCLSGQGSSLFPYHPSIEIFKAGYTNIADPYYPNLRDPAHYKQQDISWDGDKAIVRLNKLTMEERYKRYQGIGRYNIFISDDYKKDRQLFDAECNKEVAEVKQFKEQTQQKQKEQRTLVPPSRPPSISPHIRMKTE